MRDMTGAELDTFYLEQRCIFCGAGNSFLCGPRGGMMVNVKCEGCSCILNVCEGGFLPVGQVIEGPKSQVVQTPTEPVVKKGGTGWWRRLLGISHDS